MKLILKSLALACSLTLETGFACTLIYSNVRYDTLSPGVVAVTKAHYNLMLNDTVTSLRDTIRISRYEDMKTQFAGYFDSGLVFIGRIDSGFFVAENADTLGIVPARILSSPYDTVASTPRMYLKFSIDTVFRGSLPAKSFWVRAKSDYAMCGISAVGLRGKTFLNASAGFTKLSDLKAPEGEAISSLAYRPAFPAADLFDGRYFISPRFPGLSLDITELFGNYPATGIVARRFVPATSGKMNGKTYLPDGRLVPEGAKTGRKTPLPVLK